VAEEVFVPDPMTTVYEGQDYSGRNDPGCAIGLVGARNGAFSGQVVVFSKTPIRGPEAKAGDLKGKGGGVIPASTIEVRYALPTGRDGGRGRRSPANCTPFDALGAKPRESGSVHPVWVTVNVPAGVAAGEYEGKLSVGGRDVPVKLAVADWTLPKPQDYQTWADFIQSPESVAMRYGVELWSDRHWELIGECFRELAKVGNKTLYIPMICKTNLGNEQSMLRLAKQPDGSFKGDFTVIERYLDVALKNMGRPRVVCFYVWDTFSGGGYWSSGGDSSKWAGNPVSLLDPATGKVTEFESPRYGTAEAQAFWKPIAGELLDRMKKRGLDDAVMLGIGWDIRPGKEVVEMWKPLLPEVPWVIQTHGLERVLHGVPVGYCTTVWKAATPSMKYLATVTEDPNSRMHGWLPKTVQGFPTPAGFSRDIHLYAYGTQLGHGRLLAEMNVAGQQKGFGRMSADFWPCIGDGKGGFARGLSARFPQSTWNQLNLSMTPYLYPGSEGVQGTIRYEMLREGVQETEAVTLIDKAVTDKAQRAKLDGGLAKKCHEVLYERIKAIAEFNDKYNDAPDFASTGWQERSIRLYAAAAEVARVSGAK
jgi:hypothetical protein